MKILVAFTSKLGATRRTAEYITGSLDADLCDLKKGTPSVDGYGTVIFGSGIYAGRMSKSMRTFIEINKEKLEGRTVAVFVCCMFDGQKAEDQLIAATEFMGNVAVRAFMSSKKKSKDGVNADAADAFVAKIRTLS